MKGFWLAVAFMLGLAGSVHARDAATLSDDPALDARVMAIAEELRCLVCQNETIAASQADLATDLRRQIREKLKQGESKPQIIDFMVQRYGAFVRYKPAFDPTTAFLWVGPFALLAIGALVLVRSIRRRRPEAQQPRPTLPRPSSARLHAHSTSRSTTMALTVLLPLFAVGLYTVLGNRAALVAGATSDAQADADVSPEAVDAMLTKLSQRLATPSADAQADLQGWTMLGRSYSAMQRFAEAERSFAHAIALAPADASLLADRADALAMVQGQRAAGEPERLVAKALQIDPDNVKALAISGSAAYERKDYAAARDAWRKARDLSPAGSEMANGLDASLAEVGGGAAPATVAARVSGHVDLSPSLAAMASPGDTVFVFARAADGPRMPLAILRRTVADLPFDFALDDSLAMSPQMTLSRFDKVVVGVRISHSGSAMPQAGDLVALGVSTGTRADGLRLVIDTVQR